MHIISCSTQYTKQAHQVIKTESQRKTIYLLCFKSELYENLLQFFIHKVDTELLKAIFLMNGKQKWLKYSFQLASGHIIFKIIVLNCTNIVLN